MLHFPHPIPSFFFAKSKTLGLVSSPHPTPLGGLQYWTQQSTLKTVCNTWWQHTLRRKTRGGVGVGASRACSGFHRVECWNTLKYTTHKAMYIVMFSSSVLSTRYKHWTTHRSHQMLLCHTPTHTDHVLQTVWNQLVTIRIILSKYYT